ncbi:hypothetical protein AVEN_217431-1 [Araneus ventricosus]|uniref:Uncharacterized protein n=1 Tax=Araneus ventricosus TaxID=182803 RepID=A0A4Y2UKT7_ARAVE|nr:hypothetical protein AVEN_217431-1 [Araneus ventricosus]
MIENIWEGVSSLRPETVVECDFEGFEATPVEPVINEIVSLAKIVGLDNNDIDDLLEEHSQELSTEEFTELHWVSIFFFFFFLFSSANRIRIPGWFIPRQKKR